MKKIDPIETIELFPTLDQKLVEILRSLDRKDWRRSTISPSWNIHDIALHLLDGNIRGISTGRDRFFGVPAEDINTYQQLIDFLDRLNHEWIKAARRISPPLLIDLLELTNKWYYEHLKGLAPDDEAIFSVAWAGEETSPNWFHIAREYTEKFHHQQQIRLTLGADEVLLKKSLYFPFLDTMMRALPHHFAAIKADTGTALLIEVSDQMGRWYLVRLADKWGLFRSCDIFPAVTIIIDKKIAWRLFTKGIKRSQALQHITIEGNQELGENILTATAIMG